MHVCRHDGSWREEAFAKTLITLSKLVAQGARGGSGPRHFRESIPRVSVTGSTAREDMDCQKPDVEEQNKKVMTFPPEWELGSPAFADFGVKQQQVTRFPSRISKRIEASVASRTSQKMHSAI